jgi:hypothetical protein
VLFGVPVGVVFVLLTLIFLCPDLGVILLLRKAETGVGGSSLELFGVLLRGPRRESGVAAAVGAEPATRGVNGGRFDTLAEALSVGIRGREELVGLS